MTLESETDRGAGALRAKRARHGLAVRARTGSSAVADPAAREFLRRAGRKFQQPIDLGERAWSAAKPTHPTGDPQ
jgi:hypothetical protein